MNYSKPEVTLIGDAGNLIQGPKTGQLESADQNQLAQALAQYEE
jgi:hypothetical protein